MTLRSRDPLIITFVGVMLESHAPDSTARYSIGDRPRINYHFRSFLRSFDNIESSFIVVRPFRAQGRIRIRIKLPSRSLVPLPLPLPPPRPLPQSMNLIRADMRRTVICR